MSRVLLHRVGRLLLTAVLLFMGWATAQQPTDDAHHDHAHGEAAPAGEMGNYVEGIHYRRLQVPVETRNPEKVQVEEVFAYSCIYCRNFDPAVMRWAGRQPAHVDFHLVPLAFGQSFVPLSAAFFVAESLGILEQIHDPMFRALHDEGMDMRRPELIAKLFESKAGIDPEETLKRLESFDIDRQVRMTQARVLGSYGVQSTPSMVVNGRYVTDSGLTGTNENMLNVVDYLVELERKRMAGED